MPERLRQIERRFGDAMYIIAGLPPGVANRVENSLRKIRDLERAIYHVPEFARSDDRLYVEEDYIRLQRNLASIIFDRTANTNPKSGRVIITPSRILLLYICFSGREERLLREFEFFVYPIKIHHLTDLPRWRHDPSLALRAIENCIRKVYEYAPTLLQVIDEIKQRLPFTALALPAVNFHEEPSTPLREHYRELARTGAWPTINERLKLRRYRQEELPGVKGRWKRGVKAYTDNRELIFVPAREEEWHGPVRELKVFDDPKKIVNKLNEMYRIGVPMGNGFHYDMQLAGGKNFGNNIKLLCCERGLQESAGWPYANVYPNDFIRKGTE
jgi:hypothetical protein